MLIEFCDKCYTLQEVGSKSHEAFEEDKRAALVR
jgi:hypothetical protein